MNHERELIDCLCTAAGMIMEDMVEEALVSGSADALANRVASLDQAGRDIAALAQAAAVIARRAVVE